VWSPGGVWGSKASMQEIAGDDEPKYGMGTQSWSLNCSYGDDHIEERHASLMRRFSLTYGYLT